MQKYSCSHLPIAVTLALWMGVCARSKLFLAPMSSRCRSSEVSGRSTGAIV